MQNNADIIYYTDLIIDKVVKDYGYDREFVEKLYYFYVDELRRNLKETDDVSYYLPNFGTLYLTLTGANYLIMNKEKSYAKRGKERYLVQIEKVKRKREVIKSYIKKLKEAGNSKIAYFDKIFNPKGIKNA